jgi:hypothetical protein
MATPKSQIRLLQITSSLPNSSLSSSTALDNASFADTINELASSIRRLNSYDESSVKFHADAQVFKAMGSENRFVILNNQKLFVSSSTSLNGTTEVSTADGEFSVAGTNAATINVSSKLNLTGSGMHLKASSGNFEFESASGTSFVEDGTEVFSINSSRQVKFHVNAGSLAAPDVEFDGKVRFDQNFASSGSISFAANGNQTIEKNHSGHLVLSNSVGNLYFIDNNAATSTWSDLDKGIQLSSNASDWSNLQSAGITSILGGLMASSAASKFKNILSSNLNAGSATSLNMNLSSLTHAQVDSRVDVFVNGQLLYSGSSTDVGNSNADYFLDYTGGTSDVEIKFSENLISEDIIQVVIR